MIKNILLYGFIVIIVIAILIQFIPFGRNHTNQAVVKEPTWDSQQTKALFERACADCHSNNTNWPLYTNIAPFSWLIQRDVIEGRSHLNLSECGVIRPGREGGEGGEVVLNGEMQPVQYTLIYPEARLTTAERQALAQGLANSPCK